MDCNGNKIDATAGREMSITSYFANYYSQSKYRLCSAGSAPLSLDELLSMSSMETKCEWNSMSLSYTSAQGNIRLRKCIADLYLDSSRCICDNEDSQQWGLMQMPFGITQREIDPSNILITVPEQAIFLAMKCLVGKNDHIIILAPFFECLSKQAAQLGCNVDYWSFQLKKTVDHDKACNDYSWYLDTEKLTQLIKPNKTKLIIINIPHNPTGYVPTMQNYLSIVQICKKFDIWLFSDEMSWFLRDKNNIDNIPPCCVLYEKGISMCGMSKIFSMPGVRICWLITLNNQLYNKLCQTKRIYQSVPSELLSIMALENNNYNLIIKNVCNVIKYNYKILCHFVQKNNDLFELTINLNRNFAGNICFVKLNGLANKVGNLEFCVEMLHGCNVLLLPSACFEFKKDSRLKDMNFVRIGLATKQPHFEQGLSVLHEYLKQWRIKKLSKL